MFSIEWRFHDDTTSAGVPASSHQARSGKFANMSHDNIPLEPPLQTSLKRAPLGGAIGPKVWKPRGAPQAHRGIAATKEAQGCPLLAIRLGAVSP